MSQQQLELLQLLCLLAYVLKAWGAETVLTKTAILWWIAVLLVDIFVWQCARPAWLRVGVNSLDVVLGWLIIYEKYRNPCRRMLVAFLALLGGLVR